MPINANAGKDKPTQPTAERTTQGSNKKAPEPKTSKPVDRKVLIVAACIVVVLVIGVLILLFGRKDNKPVNSGQPVTTAVSTKTNSAPVTGETTSTDTVDSDRPWLDGNSEDTGSKGDVVNPTATPQVKTDGVVAGLKDISGNTVTKNSAPIVKDTFTKNLDGKTVPSTFEIDNIRTVVDFVSYTKKRTIVGKGIELYWLDATYKGQPAKIQVPLSIFKEMDKVGVVPVDVEITQIHTTSGEISEIATYFTVRTDYKQVLEDAE